MKSPEVVKRMADDGNQIVASSPAEFAAFLAADAAKWARIVRENNIQPD